MATKKQLAALAKARAAKRKKNPVKKTSVKRNPAKKVRAKRKSNPTFHAIAITSTQGKKGYLSNVTTNALAFDTLASKAMKLSAKEAKLLKPAIAQMKGVRNASVVSISSPK